LSIKIQQRCRGPWARAFQHALTGIGSLSSEVGHLGFGTSGIGRSEMGLRVDVGDKKVWIWTWDYDAGVTHVLKNHPEIDLILTVQYDPAKDWPTKVQPFTMFASNQIAFHSDLEKYRGIVRAQEKKYDLGFSGRVWNCRKPWWNVIDNLDWCEAIATHGQATGHNPWGDYMEQLGRWERCLILFGKGSKRCSNRREHECAALGIPMVLNYMPTYYHSFQAGIDYHYVSTPADIMELREGFPPEYWGTLSYNAFMLWGEHMSPEGIGRLFQRICKERL